MSSTTFSLYFTGEQADTEPGTYKGANFEHFGDNADLFRLWVLLHAAKQMHQNLTIRSWLIYAYK